MNNGPIKSCLNLVVLVCNADKWGLLLELRTQQALEYEKKTKQYTKEEIFQDDQMVYLLAPPII